MGRRQHSCLHLACEPKRLPHPLLLDVARHQHGPLEGKGGVGSQRIQKHLIFYRAKVPPLRLLSTWSTPTSSPARSQTGTLRTECVRKPVSPSIAGVK
jgi:hypothetical protein